MLTSYQGKLDFIHCRRCSEHWHWWPRCQERNKRL